MPAFANRFRAYEDGWIGEWFYEGEDIYRVEYRKGPLQLTAKVQAYFAHGNTVMIGNRYESSDGQGGKYDLSRARDGDIWGGGFTPGKFTETTLGLRISGYDGSGPNTTLNLGADTDPQNVFGDFKPEKARVTTKLIPEWPHHPPRLDVKEGDWEGTWTRIETHGIAYKIEYSRGAERFQSEADIWFTPTGAELRGRRKTSNGEDGHQVYALRMRESVLRGSYKPGDGNPVSVQARKIWH